MLGSIWQLHSCVLPCQDLFQLHPSGLFPFLRCGHCQSPDPCADLCHFEATKNTQLPAVVFYLSSSVRPCLGKKGDNTNLGGLSWHLLQRSHTKSPINFRKCFYLFFSFLESIFQLFNPVKQTVTRLIHYLYWSPWLKRGIRWASHLKYQKILKCKNFHLIRVLFN